MMKKILYTLLIVLIAIPTFAQNSTQAKNLLDKVARNYQNNPAFYLKFNSVLENNKANTKDAYAGEVYVQKEKYNLSIPKMDIQQIYDGKKLYTIAQDQKEVTVSQPDPNGDELFTPTRVFEMYKKGFKLSMDKTSKVNGKNITFVRLVPTQNNNNIKYVLVGIDENKNELVQLIEVSKKDTETTITVEKQLNDIIIPRSYISFNKSFFKDYYISEI